MPRIHARLLVVLVLALGSPRPLRACPWVPPTDPCQTEAEIQQMEEAVEVIREVPAELDPEPEGLPAREEVDAVPDPTCEEIAQSLWDMDPDVRLPAVERLTVPGADIEDCQPALEALAGILREEPDDFLVYRSLAALMFVFEPPSDLRDAYIGLLSHASPDVRRFAAQLLPRDRLEPSELERVAAHLRTERDPWVLIALAQMELPGHEAEIRSVFERLVFEEGPASAVALRLLTQEEDDPEILLRALRRGRMLRGVAIDLMARHLEMPEVQQALRHVLQEGSEKERVQAAMALLWGDAATHEAAWRQVAFGSDLSLRDRAVLVLQASYAEPWRPIACEAKRADPALSQEVAQVLADEKHLFEVMHAWRAEEPETVTAGWIEPEAGASTVRCASRPFGPPRPDHARIPAGTLFMGTHQFVQDGVEWAAEWDGACWVRADTLARKEPESEVSPGFLEVDFPVSSLVHLEASIDAGEVELFDGAAGSIGVRLIHPTPKQRSRWNAGVGGTAEVLTEVEAKAQNR